MKNNLLTLGFGAFLLTTATEAFAQTIPPALLDNPNFIVFEIGTPQGGNSEQMEEALGEVLISDTSPSNPTNTPVVVTRAALFRTTSALRKIQTSAGAESKNVVVDEPAPHRGISVYADFDWSSIWDNRGFNLDGNKFSPRGGLDLVIGPDILVGGSFTYSYERRNSETAPLRNNLHTYAFNGYAAKNFFDWVNVGVTGTYVYEHQHARAFGSTFVGDINVYSIAPFIGASHTWGALSASSTATYIYQYNDMDLNVKPPMAIGGNTDSHFYLHINELEYAVTDKFTVGGNMNFNVVIDESQNALTRAVGSTDDFWMTFGAKASYQMFGYLTGSVQFQADVFNNDYENYLTSFGLTWDF